MKSTFAIAVISLVAAAAAAPDPIITPRAELASRQDSSSSDPALLGWVDASNGQYSDQRSCDYPATLSSSGALAQCCASSTSCTFWQSCSAGTLFAGGQSTSLFCDQGFCNTAVIVPSVGASTGVSYLGCWATSLGESAFTIIKDVGSDGASASSSGSAQSSAKSSGASGKATTTAGSSATSAAGSGSSASGSQSSTGAAQSSGAAAVDAVKPLTGVFGFIAVLFGML